ncbi:MAG: hypothetical protein O3C45_08295 [Bacteroidetes bacterium]|nr:hypothetical protein [Bacteroidota bacterium]MDA0875045.1 hypothetical protein [Bacteroidota bacterium]
MQVRLLFPVFALFVLVGCGTDNPFDRGADLPFRNNASPSGPLSFASDIKPVLQVCASCHSGGAGGWVYTGGVDSYNAVLSAIDTIHPERSELLVKATGGDGHGGGSFFSVNSTSYQAIANWIAQGAENN